MQSNVSSFQNENIFSIQSEADLVQSFRPRDQKKLILPDNFDFPINVRSYLTWKESSGVYTYLVFKMPNWEIPRGVVFKRTAPVPDQGGGLCNWCHAYGPSDDIGLLSVTMSGTVTQAYYLCHDLRCIEKIEEAAARSGKNPDKGIDELYYRMGKLFEGLSNYKPEP